MTCASIGWATVASTTAEFAPGYMVVTDTWGGTMSGYCATGIARNANAPAIVVTTAMTIARRGRSTKIADNIVQLLPGAGGCGVARTGVSGRRL